MTPTDISLSIGIGIIASIIAIVTEKMYHIFEFKIKNCKYKGDYDVYRKSDQKNEICVGTLKLTVNMRDFKIKFTEDELITVGKLPSFNGKISFDRLSPKRGVGYYKQTGEGKVGHGFIECQLTDKEILVHLTWFDSERKSMHDAYRCVKLPTDDSK